MKHFCDNPNCPNYDLELNDEKHYHITDTNVVGAICEILKTHPYEVVIRKPVVIKSFHFFHSTVMNEITKTYHFCDICIKAIEISQGVYYV